MIIDSKHYDGACVCGRSHKLETVFSIVEAGCLEQIDTYLRAYGLNGFCTVVYDENTYRAEGMVHPHGDCEVILDPNGLHADEHGVALLEKQLPPQTDYIIAVGSGTVHDIVRYCAYLRGICFVSCPTAASVDGFCSSVAAMTWEGCKRTLTAVAPTIVVADLNVISKAPVHLAKSGFGDMIGKPVALAEWRIANLLTGEFFCPTINRMMEEASAAVKDSARGILAGELAAFEELMGGLLLSGLAMQMMGNSRPASGAEHHISHMIEMAPIGLGARSDALHGEKVGVATLLVCEEYHRLAETEPTWQDYTPPEESELLSFFGEDMMRSILDENRNDAAEGITGDQIRANWGKIQEILRTVPRAQELRAIYREIGVKTTLADIGLSDTLLPVLLHFSPRVRNRLTMMRLRRMIVKE